MALVEDFGGYGGCVRTPHAEVERATSFQRRGAEKQVGVRQSHMGPAV